MNFKMFFEGVQCFFVGLCRFYSKLSLVKYAVIPFVLMLGVMFAVLTLVVRVISRQMAGVEQWIASLPDWINWLAPAASFLAATAAAVIALIAGTLIILTFYEAFAGPFFDSLIKNYEKKYYDVDLKDVSFKQSLYFIWESVLYSINTLLISFVLLPLLLIPFAGPCLLCIVVGYRLGVTYTLPTGFLRGRGLREQLAFLAGQKSGVLGFGITVYLLFMLPVFVSIFLLPGVILGGTELLHRIEDDLVQRDMTN